MNTEQTDTQSYLFLYNLKLNIFKIKTSNKLYCAQAGVETIKPKMLSKRITLFTKSRPIFTIFLTFKK